MAIAFAFAGHAVHLIDAKARSPEAFADLQQAAVSEIHRSLSMLAGFGLLDAAEVEAAVARICLVPLDGLPGALAEADVIFEGVPEQIDANGRPSR